MDKFISRKLIVTLVAMAAAVGAAVLGEDSLPPEVLEFLQWVVATYVVGQGAVDAVDKLKGPVVVNEGAGDDAPDA